jgi:hypothetical protein
MWLQLRIEFDYLKHDLVVQLRSCERFRAPLPSSLSAVTATTLGFAHIPWVPTALF